MLFRINEIRPYAAARAAPYEKGTETCSPNLHKLATVMPRARPPMRRGLKLHLQGFGRTAGDGAARAAPYEKGTETTDRLGAKYLDGRRRARGPL